MTHNIHDLQDIIDHVIQTKGEVVTDCEDHVELMPGQFINGHGKILIIKNDNGKIAVRYWLGEEVQ